MSENTRGMNRRKFISLAAATTLAITKTPLVRATVTSRKRFAQLTALAPGRVKPSGWLKLYLEKQAEGLGLHLPEVSSPFTHAYWAGEQEARSWWPWEQEGYWIDGALRCALLTGDRRLLEAAQAPVDFTLEHQDSDGYLGPLLCKNGREEGGSRYDNFRWPHTVFFRALAAQGEATGDTKIPEAMRKHYMHDHAPYGGPSRDVTNVEAMLWAFERTGDPALLAMAEKAWKSFLESADPGDRESGDLHPDRVLANTPIHAHGVTYIEKAKLPAILYQYTGDDQYLLYALAAQERIFSHHMLISGIPSTSEDYQTTTALDAHETCDISDHTWSWGYLLMATGDGIWADRIERAAFNAGMGAIKKDWKGHQYFSCPNQVLATETSCHVPLAYGKGWMSYRPNGGQGVACCGGNVHRFLPNYVIRMWMKTKDGGLAAALYGPSTVTAEIGDGDRITIHEETQYPFDEIIHFTIDIDVPREFPLSLRIPSWCTKPSLYWNEKAIPIPPIENGFVRLKRRLQSGDKITLALPMKPQITYWPNSGIGIERGPLVYSLPIREDWSSVVEPKWSTSEFPDWNAHPAEPWNFGIAVDETELLRNISLVQKGSSQDPFVHPPIALAVPLRKIPDWQIATDPRDSKIKLTPQLPRVERDSLKTHVEMKTLVPYGSTHLRLTILPQTVSV